MRVKVTFHLEGASVSMMTVAESVEAVVSKAREEAKRAAKSKDKWYTLTDVTTGNQRAFPLSRLMLIEGTQLP